MRRDLSGQLLVTTLNFWHDKWLNLGTVRSLIEGPLNRKKEGILLQDVMRDNGLNLSNLSFDFPNLIQKVVLTTPLKRFSARKDQRSWISSLNGEFDSKNAYLLAIDEDLEALDFHG
nr:hypothetical protein CFP56_25121 [Quercus suber]